MGEKEDSYIEMIEEHLAGHTSREEFSSIMQLSYPSMDPEEELHHYQLALDLIELQQLRKTLKNIGCSEPGDGHGP